MLTEKNLFSCIRSRFDVSPKRIVHTATILKEGWEMDNEGWVVELEDGSLAAYTTSHGGVYEWTLDEAVSSLEETEASAASIRRAIEIMKGFIHAQEKPA